MYRSKNQLLHCGLHVRRKWRPIFVLDQSNTQLSLRTRRQKITSFLKNAVSRPGKRRILVSTVCSLLIANFPNLFTYGTQSIYLKVHIKLPFHLHSLNNMHLRSHNNQLIVVRQHKGSIMLFYRWYSDLESEKNKTGKPF